MELCIKTKENPWFLDWSRSFNPCFNGTMYKNLICLCTCSIDWPGFNPCFNGTMYKNKLIKIVSNIFNGVSILVLMELCIKTLLHLRERTLRMLVSILVLMELCIKTNQIVIKKYLLRCFNPCFNGTMYKNCSNLWSMKFPFAFQSLF